jgi:release factor glutamine methyltransferase
MANNELTVSSALDTGTHELAGLGAEARREAEFLLAAALECSRGELLARRETPVADAVARRYRASLVRRAQGEPLAYLTGRKEFWTLDLEVDARVLIPRPETELLVEFALQVLPVDARARVLDLGTGSGAVALAIASERPHARVVATDVSADAITVACRNAERLELGNVSFEIGDWYEPVGAMHFDLIVSNPPYVAAHDASMRGDGVVAEPRIALTPGPRGLEAIERIAVRAHEHLRPGGWLAVEHGAAQAQAVCALFSNHGLSTIRSLADLAGLDRVTCGKRAS